MGAFGGELGQLSVSFRSFCGDEMIKYIYTDILGVLKYFPGAVLIGVPLSLGIVFAVNRWRGKRGKDEISVLPKVLFGIYLMVMFLITFFSRESGSRIGVDLELFSTWGINERNNAFVIENVLLFLPYGFVSCLALKPFRKILPCTALGMLTSLCIECLQLVTRRGYFQLDDILTNTLGALLGCLCCRLVFRKRLQD